MPDTVLRNETRFTSQRKLHEIGDAKIWTELIGPVREKLLMRLFLAVR